MQTHILEYLENTVGRAPDRIALIQGESRITFAQLRERAIRLCGQIAPFFRPGQPVIVLTEKSVETIVAFLAVLYGGGYYVPLGRELPKKRLAAIGGQVSAPLALGRAADLEAVEGLAARSFALDQPHEEGDGRLAERWRGLCDVDPMYVIFTSGSTGVPKGVVTSHRAAIDYLETFAEATGVDENDVFGNQAPLDYVAAIRDIYLPMKTGARTVLLEQQLFSFPGRLFDRLDENGVTTLCWVVSALCIPAQMNMLRERAPKTVRKIIFTGTVMPPRYLAMWQRALPGAVYINHYGPTEITASCTYAVIDHTVSDNEQLPIGRPFRNTGILLLDEHGGLVEKPGVVGELCVRGSGLALGYYGDEEKSKAAFIQNPANHAYRDLIYRTGDLAHADEDGVYWFHGRKDNQIKHMGHRVELDEIALSASGVPGVGGAACLYDWEKQLIWLFYESSTATPTQVAAALRCELPAFMMPRKFHAMERLPLLPNGKVDKKALEELMLGDRRRAP